MADLSPQIDLKADCTQCAALCCVSLAFDKGDSFAIDKPAGVACPNLSTDHQCSIHTSLGQDGFTGCMAYDCTGAGQRVTQEVFAGKSWQDTPALLPPMMIAFAAMRNVHEQIVLLNAAAELPLSSEETKGLHGLIVALNPAEGFTENSLAEIAESDVMANVRDFLKSLRHHFDAAD